MRTKNPGKAKSIIEYVDSFFEEYRRSPSVREIEAGTGIPRDTVHNCMRYNIGPLLHSTEKAVVPVGTTAFSAGASPAVTLRIRRYLSRFLPCAPSLL